METIEPIKPAPQAAMLPASEVVPAGEARFFAVVTELPEALVVVDRTGGICALSAKAESMFGYCQSEVVGRDVAMLLGPLDGGAEDWSTRIERANHHDAREGIVTAQRRDGSSLPAAVSWGHTQGGELILFLRDLSEHEQAQHRLNALQIELCRVSGLAALGTLAATFAHQLNPALTAAVNYLEGAQVLLEAENPDLGPVRAALGEAASQAFRAGQIVHRLRDAVSWRDPEQRVESLPQLVDEASGLALIGYGESGINVHVCLDRSAEKVLADGIQVQQVMLNLIRNAMEAMENSSVKELQITSRREPDGYVSLTVADSGPGIGEEVSARLFQPFASTKADGLGLGLSICRSIVEAHGGRIWTEPSKLGGAAFHFTLVDAEPGAE